MVSRTRKRQILPLDTQRKCPAGYKKRYKRITKKGQYFPPACILVQNPPPSPSPLPPHLTRRRKAPCPPGQVLRKGYIRKFGTAIREDGYLAKRGEKTVLIHPTKKSPILVKAACVKERGAAAIIGHLKAGDLTKFGYSYLLKTSDRQHLLAKAVIEYGAKSVYHKLDAVAKLSVTKAPSASAIFKRDRDWIYNEYM